MERQARRSFAFGTAQRNSAVMRHSARKTKLPTIAKEASGRLSKLQQARNPGRERPLGPTGSEVIISKNRICNWSIHPFRMPCTGWPRAEDKMALDGTSGRRGCPSGQGSLSLGVADVGILESVSHLAILWRLFSSKCVR